jgi:hypothetical protein
MLQKLNQICAYVDDIFIIARSREKIIDGRKSREDTIRSK